MDDRLRERGRLSFYSMRNLASICALLTLLMSAEASAQRSKPSGGGISLPPVVVPPTIEPIEHGIGTIEPPDGGIGEVGNFGTNPPGGGPGDELGGGDDPPPPSNAIVPPFDADEYLEDVRRSTRYTTYFRETVYVGFSADERLRIEAMRRLLKNLISREIREITLKSIQVLAEHRAALEADLTTIEESMLGWFRWQTKAELRNNIETTRATERDMTALEERARNEANRGVDSWSPPPGWQDGSNIEIRVGESYNQLVHIAFHGW